jgi:LysM repeat protein
VRLALLIIVLLLAPPAWARPKTHTVRRGDTLTSIAKKHDLKISELRRWNGLGRGALQIGDKLHLRKNTATRSYRVKKGETLGRIAKQEGVVVDDILAVNPGLRAKRLRAGQFIELPGGMAGSANKKPRQTKTTGCPGKMVPLSKHPYYRLRSKDASWATQQTTDSLRRGFDHLRSRHKLAPAVHVHDASSRGGGKLGDHLSHRDGRDIDISYYQRRCPKSGCPVRVVKPAQLDVRRQWTLIRYWLKRGDVEAVFIDHRLQKLLYKHAKKQGATKQQLRTWFQYPDPPTTRRGIIRHWDSHRNHVHARFKSALCPDGCCRAKRR